MIKTKNIEHGDIMNQIEQYCKNILNELNPTYDFDNTLRRAFKDVIKYLNEFPDKISNRSKKNPINPATKDGISQLAITYFNAFYSPTIPKTPTTVPDEMVSVIMETVFGYSKKQIEEIKITHQQSMACENAVGSLLERYLDSVLRPNGWAWCCGDFVKAIDFIKYEDGVWYELQIKNRDNSENSSSSAIREGTNIHKWFRTKSRTGETMWNNVPIPMQSLGLSEDGFKKFVEQYLKANINLGKGN